tara:strand:+ start:59 stop:241 length:183 start_codon:yes stop_codon:yes gene_type:complete
MALEALFSNGAVIRSIPISTKTPPIATIGNELFIPPSAFPVFTALVTQQKIIISYTNPAP